MAKKENKWFIGITERQENPFDLSDIFVIEPDPDHYEADPILFEKDGRTWLFYEGYDYDKGVIAVREISDIKNNIHIAPPTIVLDMPYHLSFPFVYQEGKEIYMLPEMGRSGQQWRFRATEFPYKWEPDKCIASGIFADPIYDRGWYLMTHPDDDLHTYDNTGWVSTKTALNNRSAGAIFEHNGERLRPVQNSHPNYGSGVILKKMNGEEYMRLPKWREDLTGFHTFSISSKYVAVDGRVPYAPTIS